MKDLLLHAVLIGAGATLVMDGWALLLRQLGVPSMSFALLGRWLGRLGRARWKEKPLPRELLVGWCAHYAIGITFAALLLVTFGIEWARSPSLGPALFIGLVTVIAPLFVLQPAFGLGIASSKTPRPFFNATKSIVTHLVYGVGLYLSARVL